MFCPKCENWEIMKSTGDGDYICPECHYKKYAESEEDFNDRVWDQNYE